MQFQTLTQIKQRLWDECDIEDEGFIDSTELLAYINAAINDTESIIHSLYEDYFLAKTTITLVSGTQTYSAPSDIYSTKIRSLVYNNTGTSVQYEVKRIQRLHQAAEYSESLQAPYRYIVTNSLADGIKINLFPVPAESGAFLDCWYIRNARTLSSNSDECDIPEFIEFVFSNVKWRIARKEKFGQDLETAQKEFLLQRELLERTLTDMIPDESSNVILKDMSFYNDFDSPMINDIRRD